MKFDPNKYSFVRVAALSPELKVADTIFNADKIIELSKTANSNAASIILFPELSITSYTCGDLFLQSKLLDQAKKDLNRIVEISKEINSVVIVGLPLEYRSKLFNVAAICSGGKVIGVVPKSYLCNYSEYYEDRWFTSGVNIFDDKIDLFGEKVAFGIDLLFDLYNDGSTLFGIEICEDLWSVIPPSSNLALAGAHMIFNLSASNEALGKYAYRKELIGHQSARTLTSYIYASSGAGESSTDLCFSGHCLVYENGKLLAENERFSFNDQIIYADIDIEKINNERLRIKTFANQQSYDHRVISCNHSKLNFEIDIKVDPHPFIPIKSNRAETCNEIFNIQSTALAQRISHIGIKNLVLGLSGGLDSTLALLVAIRSFKKLGIDTKGIHAIVMPGPGSTSNTQINAKELAKKLNCTLKVIDINPAVDQHLKDLDHSGQHDITFENAQARERTQILMNYSNKVNGIVLGTGDLSELALGWCTYNGDQMSMYGVNSGVPKTLVKYIIEWASSELFNDEVSKVINRILDTPISPELIPGSDDNIEQKTEDKIGPYELHDFFLFNMFRYSFSPSKIFYLAIIAFKETYSKEDILKWLKVFYKRFFISQFKRSAMPDGVKVGSVALSPRGDWRMPSDASFNIWMKELDEIS